MEENKKLSSEEQRERMKEEYKRELRARKEFLEKVKDLKRSQTLLNALEGMNVEDDSDEWIAKLNQETALREAKTEIALESAEAALPVEPVVPELSEAELKKIAAAEAVRKMKEEMAGQSSTSTTNTAPTTDAPNSEDEERPSRKMLDGLL